MLGSHLVQFALIWYLTITTESATVLALSTLVGLLPQIVLGPLIGPLIDRWNRRLILMVADSLVVLATVVLAVLFAIGSIQIWHIYLLLFIRALGGGFHGFAMIASTSLMVPKEHLTRIQGINQTLNGGLTIVAAPLGALLLDLLPMQGILAIDIVTALFAIIPLFFIDIPQPEHLESEDEEQKSIGQDLKAGLRYVFSWPGMVVLMGIFMLLNLVATPAFSLLPLLVRGYFDSGALQLAWLEASVGIGFVFGGVLLSVWGGFKRRIVTIMFGLIGLGVSMFAVGMIPASDFNLALVAGFGIGMTIPMIDGPLLAILQASVNPKMQGRVMSIVFSAAKAMTPIGLVIAGPVADKIDVQSWYLLSGGISILVGAAGFVIPVVMKIEDGHPSESVEEIEVREKQPLVAL